jgi:hypothetical protein
MSTQSVEQTKTKSSAPWVALAWLAVGVPLLFGIAQTVSKAAALFH